MVKFSVYLNRRVFVMSWCTGTTVSTLLVNCLQKHFHYTSFGNVFTMLAATREKSIMTCAPSKYLNQSAYFCSLIIIFVVRMKKRWVLGHLKCTQWRFWQTVRLCRVIWIFAWHSCQNVRFLIVWHFYNCCCFPAFNIGDFIALSLFYN